MPSLTIMTRLYRGKTIRARGIIPSAIWQERARARTVESMDDDYGQNRLYTPAMELLLRARRIPALARLARELLHHIEGVARWRLPDTAAREAIAEIRALIAKMPADRELDAAARPLAVLAERLDTPLAGAPSEPPPFAPDAGDPKHWVLGVDSDPLEQALLADIVAATGGEFVGADTAEEAVSLLRRYGFDACVAPQNAAGFDGSELLAHIRATPAIAQLPVVLLGDDSGAYGAGACAVVRRPFDPVGLGRLLRSESLRYREAQALRRQNGSLTFLARIVQFSPWHMVMASDLDGRVVYINQELTRLTGVRLLAGRRVSCRDLKICDAGAKYCLDCQAATESGQRFNHEITIRNAMGEEVPALMSVFGLRGGGGEITHIVRTIELLPSAPQMRLAKKA
ncbi:hypothetical protein FACS1894186_1940 [Alphaproteobacteria bacterium]|nr:hypothetical protein FACS1894186_1940 [Alphaproteobacteria bacterium]